MAMSELHRQTGRAETRLALEAAEQLCETRGSRLTTLRRRVLEIILDSGQPLGAYAILDMLRADGRRGAPPTVYRALDFLLEQGLIHRLASRNMFIGCVQPERHHNGQFLICRDCGQVDELDSRAVERTIREQAAEQGFRVDSQMVEILGRCRRCGSRCSDTGPLHHGR